MKIWGVVGGEAAESAGLTARLVAEFAARGLSVSTLKQAAPDFDVDRPGKDSFRHREAGATEVILSSRRRWALMHEMRDDPAPGLDALIQTLSPVDLVLIEGFETGPHPKIETHRPEAGLPLRAPVDTTIRAVASSAAPGTGGVPRLDLNDTQAIADFVAEELGL